MLYRKISKIFREMSIELASRRPVFFQRWFTDGFKVVRTILSGFGPLRAVVGICVKGPFLRNAKISSKIDEGPKN